ncbi:retrovirus-related Pol polyprotein from transposon 297 [Trichonephila clavipes]|nr:retrovirus-related Pol polyprotein from transposon 297 [Trichonephila clavipes]
MKQSMLDNHIEKMLKAGTIIMIQSPYTSPVVLCRKNNDLPPDNPEAYRFAAEYRKLNVITKCPRYPLPLIDELITDIHTLPSCRPSILDQVKFYYQKKSDENEIRVSSSDSDGSRYKSNSFEGVRPRSNESQCSKNNGSGERREVKGNETGLKEDQSEGHTSITGKRRPLIRSSHSSWTELNRRSKKSRKEIMG